MSGIARTRTFEPTLEPKLCLRGFAFVDHKLVVTLLDITATFRHATPRNSKPIHHSDNVDQFCHVDSC